MVLLPRASGTETGAGPVRDGKQSDVPGRAQAEGIAMPGNGVRGAGTGAPWVVRPLAPESGQGVAGRIRSRPWRPAGVAGLAALPQHVMAIEAFDDAQATVSSSDCSAQGWGGGYRGSIADIDTDKRDPA